MLSALSTTALPRVRPQPHPDSRVATPVGRRSLFTPFTCLTYLACWTSGEASGCSQAEAFMLSSSSSEEERPRAAQSNASVGVTRQSAPTSSSQRGHPTSKRSRPAGCCAKDCLGQLGAVYLQVKGASSLTCEVGRCSMAARSLGNRLIGVASSVSG